MSRGTTGLAGKTLGAGAWTVGARLLGKLIDLATLLVLARFLGPADFGLVATAMVAIFIAEAVLELPLATALLRARRLTEPLLQTAFTLGLLRGVAIATLMAALAWPLARFYGEPRLVALICLLALAPAMRGLISPRMVVFARRHRFRPEASLEVLGKTASFCVALAVALATGRYWAIAAATLCTPLVMLLVSYRLAPLRPRLTLAGWPQFADMLGWNLLAQLAAALNWQLDRMLLPRFVPVAGFGRYAMAGDLSTLPFQAITTPIQRPLMATYRSALASGRTAEVHAHATRTLLLALLPVFVLMALWAEPVVAIVLGRQWSQTAALLRWLALVQLLAIPAIPVAALAMMLNRTRLVAVLGFAQLLARLPLLYLLVSRWGASGAIANAALALTAGLLATLAVVRTLTGRSAIRQLADLLPAPLAMLPAAALALTLRPALETTLPLQALLPRLAGAGLLCLAVYLATTWLLWRARGGPAGPERYLHDRLAAALAGPRRRTPLTDP